MVLSMLCNQALEGYGIFSCGKLTPHLFFGGMVVLSRRSGLAYCKNSLHRWKSVSFV